MPTFEDLRLGVGELITPEWYDRLVEHLTNIAFRGAVTYHGDVYTDLKPHPDLALNLGLPDLRFKAVYAGYGYFDYGVYPPPPAVWYGGVVKEDVYPEADLALNLGLPGLRWKQVHAGYGYFDYGIYPPPPAVWYGGVVKSDVYPETDLAINLGFSNLRWKQTHAGYGYFSHDLYARGYRVLTEVDPITIQRDLTTEPILLGQQVEYSAPDLADVFSPDLTAQRSGRVRAQFTLQMEAVSYLKMVPYGTPYEVVSALAAGNSIPPYAWHEFDLTVQKDDEVNVRFSPATIVTVRVYNIGST